MKKRKSFGKRPTKTDLNLFFRVDKTAKPATLFLYGLLVIACLLCASKFVVYDLWMEDMAAKDKVAEAELNYLAIQRQVSDYNAVKEEYQRYAATDEELELLDRIQILNLIDDAVGSKADVDSVNIRHNTVTVKFSGVTLKQSSEIVRSLEESDMVESVIVTTANTDNGGRPEGDDDNARSVSAMAIIELVKVEADDEA